MDSWLAFWKRLDRNGSDACRVQRTGEGWAIDGVAAFVESDVIVNLSYQLLCDSFWKAERADVRGWINGRDWRLQVERRSDGLWMADGLPLDLGEGLVDIDLGFTPATNTNAIRRLALEVGQKAQTTALWLDTSDWTLKPLPQTYERVSPASFAYASPQHGYYATLQTNAFGIVLDYPGLWRAQHVANN